MLPQSLEHSPLPAWVSCPSELLNAGILSPFSPPPPPRIVTNKQMSGQGSPSFYKPAATKKNCFGKPKKSVRWGAARTYKSSTSPEEVHVSWYTVSSETNLNDSSYLRALFPEIDLILGALSRSLK
jgi:hypothetical protein